MSHKQLGLHDKPIVVLDADGYWRPLLDMLERGFAKGFIQSHYRGLWTVAETPAQAIEQIANAAPSRARTPDPRGGGTG
jgi:predicted Rossmann-fold nucleotide-binding protein